MDEIKKKKVLSILNRNVAPELQVLNNSLVNMGLGTCEIRCLRVNVSGSYLSKSL